MARGKRNEDLLDRLRKAGMRTRVAKTLAGATSRSSKKTPKRVQEAAAQLRAVASELEDRARGGPAKRKAAANKGARTRARNARKRSEAAKRGAKTRSKSGSR
jgi:hypothetical protein